MAINFLDNIQLNQNQLLGARIGLVPSDPTESQQTGDIIYNSGTNILKYWNGTSWVSLTEDTVLPTASKGTLGGVKLFDDTEVTSSVNAVSTTADRWYGVQFNGSDQMVINVPWQNDNTQETYTLPVTAGGSNSARIDLVAAGTSSGVKSTVTFAGTADEIAITETAQNNGTVTIGLPDDVTVSGVLSVSKTITVSGEQQSSFAGQVTIPETPVATTDAASKAYVDAANLGNLIFQGGYNAATNVPDLDSSPSSSIKKGWSYVVTAAGSFFTETVEVGDFIIAQQDAPTALANWVTVQNNTSLATLTNVGIGNVNNEGLTEPNKIGLNVSYTNGTASIGFDIKGTGLMDTIPADDDRILIWDSATDEGGQSNAAVKLSTLKTYFSSGATGINLLLNSALAGVTKATSGGVTTFTIDVTNATNAFGSGVTAINVKTEVLTAAGETVYAKVTRSGNNLIIAFVGTIADSAYRVLLVNVA
tara:strand:+ start:1959 stop:3389 length:1431 start_codon:yes stop_codon:yes gene_type:complete